MPILTILLVIVIVGLLLWLVNQYVPMDAAIKKILNIVVIIALILWLLQAFGVWHYLSSAHV